MSLGVIYTLYFTSPFPFLVLYPAQLCYLSVPKTHLSLDPWSTMG